MSWEAETLNRITRQMRYFMMRVEEAENDGYVLVNYKAKQADNIKGMVIDVEYKHKDKKP